MLGLEGFDDDAERQARFFDERIPVYGRLLRALGRVFHDDPGVRARIEAAWAAREFHAYYERPLLACAALRSDALADSGHPLSDAIGVGSDPSRLDESSLLLALAPEMPVWGALRARYVQTNEVTRAIAWRLPQSLLPPGSPLVLADLGCSAALNLVADRLDLQWSDDTTGAPIALAPPSCVIARVGLDRSPIDARVPADRAWLRACLWPGQTERMARLDAALAAAESALGAGEIALLAASAGDMPAHLERLAAENPTARVLAYHTIFAEYLAPDDRASFDHEMEAWLRRHPTRAIWVAFESAAPRTPGPAALRVRLDDRSFLLASSDYHPRSLALLPGVSTQLAEALSALGSPR